ncbi:MAG: hypothetical protein Kow0099_24370 [Candidatus Abyssubacteria bacterium]
MFKITFFPEQFIWVAHPEGMKLSLADVTEGEAVFVSGKLMDPEFVRGVTGHHVAFTAAMARDYERGERGSGNEKMLLLQPRPGAVVLGTVLLKLTRADIDALDRFEQVPALRTKSPLRVTIGAHERMATTYLLRE